MKYGRFGDDGSHGSCSTPKSILFGKNVLNSSNEADQITTIQIQGSEVAPQASSDETPRKSHWERFVEFKEQSAGKHWNPLINIMRKHHRFEGNCNRVYILNQLTLLCRFATCF